MSALETDVIEWVDVNAPGFTDDEAYALLAGIGSNTSTLHPLVAAANEGHTGAMIALVPSDADVKRLKLKNGEKPDQLHLTLVFLGEADRISEKTRAQIIAIARSYAAKTPIQANAFAVNVFNPTGDEPCVVLGVGNGDSNLEGIRSNVLSAVRGMDGFTLPEQHTPWIPHVTMRYTNDFSVVAELADRTGPITFDKIRVAFGDEVTDIHMEVPVGTTDEDDDDIMTSAAIAGNIMRALASDRNLRNYWTHGAGAAKIRWGTDGSFSRCVRHLGKYVTRPQGLCAEYHKEATGEWPAEKGIESAVDDHDFASQTLTAATKRKTDLERKFKKDQGKNSDDFHQVGEQRKKTQYADEPWEGVLAVEGTESGDSRLFNLGSLDWATLPLPLMYQPANVGGHNASVVVGLITQVARKGNEIRGWGHVYGNMLAGEHGNGIRNMMEAGGVSVDVDKVKDADVEEVFADGDEGGFLARPEVTIFNRGRVRGATLVAFPAFVEAKLAFTGDTMTASTDRGCGCDGGIVVASGHTITIPDLPPVEWFQKPTDVKMYGALTITDQGRIFGWVAPSDTTHRSVRKTVPMGGRVDYSRWMNKETIVAGGHRIKTGVLTMGCGHAATSNYGTLQNRKEHYDNTCSIFANAVVGEEPGKGVWFAGALRHGVTADQVTAALGSSLSGDWQPHPDRPGVQEFIAALLVPVPGFPMARSRPSVEYQDGLITASVVPVRYGVAEPRSRGEVALDAITQAKQIVMSSLGLDVASEKRAAMALIEGM